MHHASLLLAVATSLCAACVTDEADSSASADSTVRMRIYANTCRDMPNGATVCLWSASEDAGRRPHGLMLETWPPSGSVSFPVPAEFNMNCSDVGVYRIYSSHDIGRFGAQTQDCPYGGVLNGGNVVLIYDVRF